MALINCPECNKQISDKAKICINCGYPIEDIMQQSANENLQTNAEKTTNGRIYRLFEANYNSYLEERNNNVDSIYYDVVHEIYNLKNEIDTDILNDIIGIEIIDGLSLSPENISWMSVKLFCELIDFQKLSTGAKNKISDKLYKLISFVNMYNDGSSNRPYIMVFWFPLYNILQNSNIDEYDEIMAILNEPNYYGSKTGIEYIDEMYEKHGLNKSQPRQKIEYSQSLKCPICNSTNVRRISTVNRFVSFAAVGFASSKIGKQYECKKCKYKW